MILITVLCLNVLSEGMADAMVSPRLRRKEQVEDDIARTWAGEEAAAVEQSARPSW